MSQKKLEAQFDEKARNSSVEEGITQQETKPPVFYRCVCPECGEDTLELSGFDVFFRSEFLGVTHDGEFGCGALDLDGEYNWVLECGECGYTAFDTDELPSDTLVDWAVAHGRAIRTLDFTCPVCGEQYLERIERGSRDVRAVYEIPKDSETEGRAEVALSYAQVMAGGDSIRYSCCKGHELSKEDGSPVKTPEELVEWLKAHQASSKE